MSENGLAPVDTSQSQNTTTLLPPGEKEDHTTRRLIFAAASTAGTIVVGIATQKWGADVPDWAFILLCLIPLSLWFYWAWTHPRIKQYHRLIYNYPMLSLAIMIGAGACVGGSFGALFWFSVQKQKPSVAAQNQMTTQATPSAQTPQPPTPAALNIHSDVQITRLELHIIEAPPSLLVSYKNGSGVVATDSQAILGKACFGTTVPFPTDQKELDKMFADFVESFDKADKATIKWGPRLGPGETNYEKFHINELMDQELKERVINGETFLYFVGGIKFSDQTGHYRKGFCYSFVPPTWRGPSPTGSSPFDIMGRWFKCDPSNMAAWEAKADEDRSQ